MSIEKPIDLSASVHQKLLNRARSDVRPFNELLQYYSIERFLSRLSSSSHREKTYSQRSTGTLGLAGPRQPADKRY